MRANTVSQKVPDALTKPPGLRLGINEYRHQSREVFLPHPLRNRHIYIVGATGTGKSTLLTNLILQDIEAGRGFALLDPHGDLVKDVLPLIPKRRVKDAVLFNAADRGHPISINPLIARDRAEIDLLTNDFMVMFKRFFSVEDAHRLQHILRHTIKTLLSAGGKTFTDIARLLTKAEFRREVLKQITDPVLLEFWQEEFPMLPKGASDPIINKLSPFTLNDTMRNILGQPHSKLNFFELMQQEKIFLANLAQGEIQEENSSLLGSFLVSQFQLATMRRASLTKHERTDFTLYIDEFQNYTNSAFDRILSEARKYQLNLVIAHQHTAQLDDEVRKAIFGNVGTLIFFKIGAPEDARYVTPLLRNFDAEILHTLKRGQTIVSVSEAGQPFSMQALPPPPKPAQNCASEIISHSRANYATTPAVAPKPAPANDEQSKEEPPEDPAQSWRQKAIKYLENDGCTGEKQTKLINALQTLPLDKVKDTLTQQVDKMQARGLPRQQQIAFLLALYPNYRKTAAAPAQNKKPPSAKSAAAATRQTSAAQPPKPAPREQPPRNIFDELLSKD